MKGGFIIRTASNCIQAIQIVEQQIINQEIGGQKQNYLFNLMIVDIDNPLTNGEAYCKKIKDLYQKSKIVPYVSQQCFDNEDVAIVEAIPLNIVYPVITAWTNEEVKSDGLN